MKQLIFSRSTWLLLFGILLIRGVQAQECSGNVYLSTQEQVNAFNCSEIGGDLYIWGDVYDLSPLSVLTRVEGKILIYYTSELTTINGFQNLVSVGGHFLFESNSALTSISGIDNLTSIGGDVQIRFNNSLVNLSGFSNLISTGGNFDIEYNPSLINFDAFQNLTTIGGMVTIYFNTLLTDLDGLQSLTNVGDDFWFLGNSSLANLEGLHNLNHIGGVLALYGLKCPDLSGLRNLAHIGTDLYIYDDVYLTNLDNLQNLTFVGSQIIIWENPVLERFCGLYNLLSQSNVAYYANNNLTNPNRAEIIAGGSCNTAPKAFCKDLSIAANENCQALITPEDIDNGSFDPDGDDISLSISPEGPYGPGSTTVTLTVTDEYGATDQCSAIVTVNDESAPVIIMKESNITLWPPNHDYTTFLIGDLVDFVSDNCGVLSPENVSISHATSDEPEDAPGNGDGKTLNDIVISGDCQSVQLRQERQGNGNGRVYTVHVKVADASGNNGTANCKVYVPHNSGETPVDDGIAYSQECGFKSVPVISSLNTDELKVYPTPFSGNATIEFSTEESVYAKLSVYNSFGKEVAVLFEGITQPEQSYKLDFDGKSFPGGVYYCRLQSGKKDNLIKKMILMK